MSLLFIATESKAYDVFIICFVDNYKPIFAGSSERKIVISY